MPTAIIKSTVSAIPITGSRDDVSVGNIVSLEHDGVSGTSYFWEFVNKPPGSTATFSPSASNATPSFTPDAVGSYRVRLTIDGDSVGANTRIIAVKTAELGIRIPAAGETNEYDNNPSGIDGWHEALYDALAVIDAQIIRSDGTGSGPTGDISLNNNKLIDVGVPSGPNDAARFVDIPASLVTLNTKIGVTLDTSSDTRDPNAHGLGGAAHSSTTLAALNLLISDANLDDSGDARAILPHGLGDAYHTSTTLAALNLLISDANLDDSSDVRFPSSHAMAGAEHVSTSLATFNSKITDAVLVDGSAIDMNFVYENGADVFLDQGPIVLSGANYSTILGDGYITLSERTDPAFQDGYGAVYTKDVSGITELFYVDSAGTVTQITDDGYLDTFNSLRGVGLWEQSSDPVSQPGKAHIYAKDSGGNTELYFKDSSGNLIKITELGSVVGAGIGGEVLDAYAPKELLDAYATTSIVDGYALTSALDTYAEKSLLDSYATTDVVDGYALASDLSTYAEKTLLDSYATSDVVDGYALATDLDTYAEKVLLDSYATPDVVEGYAPKALLDSYLSSAVLDGYVSTETLEDYALKTLLDSYATLDVVDGYALESSLSVYAEKALLDGYLSSSELDGYVSEESLSVYAEKVLLDSYALASDLDPYAEKVLLDSYLSSAVLDGYASNESLEDYALKALLDSYATTSIVDGYALESALSVYAEKVLLDSYLSSAVLDGYVSSEDLEDYALKTLLDAYALESDLNTYAEKVLLDGYLSSAVLDGYVSAEALEDYALKTLLDSYAALDVVDGYALDSSLSVYAEKALLDSYLSAAVLDGYVSQEALEDYALKVLLDSYASLDVVDGYALASDLNSYAEKSLLDSYLSSAVLDGYVSSETLEDYALKTLLDSYATTYVVDGYALESDLEIYAEKSLLDSYLTADDLEDGYIGFSYDELDPSSTDGYETSLELTFTPVDANALNVYRNGVLMRRVVSLDDDYQEYTLSGSTVSFLATGETGEWYASQYIDSYNLLGSGSSVSCLNYLSTTQPAGASSPEAVYQFDKSANSLNDRTSNGHNLIVTGNSRHAQWDSNLKGFYFDGSTKLIASLSSALHFTGAKTLEVVCSLDARGSFSAPILMEPVATGESEASNILYHIYTQSTTGEISYQHETTSAANIQENSDYIIPLSNLYLWTATVDSAGTGVKLYINGQLIHSNTLSGAAVDGSNGVLQIGLNCTGIISSVRITGSEYTSEQVLEAAQQVGLA